MKRGSSGLGIGGHHAPHRGANDEWLTPPEIVESLGPFDLDPCSPIVRPWDTAKTHLSVVDDGLTASWDDHGVVWLNPPYGPATWSWLSKLSTHPAGGVALIFARTETAGFFAEVWSKATAVLFLAGRLHFHYVDGTRAKANSGAPSVLVAYGEEAADRLKRIGRRGALIRLDGGTR